MAQEQVNTILQVLQNSMQQMEAKRQYADALALRQQEAQERKLEFEERKRQNEVQEKANEKLAALRDAENQRQQAEFEFRQARESSQSGITPPGVQMIPGVKPTLEQQLIHSAVAQNQLVFPSGHVISAPTQEDYYKEQGRLQALANEPLAEAKFNEAVREAQMKQRFEQVQHDRSFQDQLAILGRQQDFQERQQNQRLQAEKDIANLRANTSLSVAGLRSKGNLTGYGGVTSYDEDTGAPVYTPNNPETIINNTIEQAAHGRMTLEEFKTRYPLTKQAGQDINSTATNSGIKFITKKQLDDLRELEQVAGITEKLKRLQDLRKDHWFQLQFPMSDASNTFNSLQEQVKGELAGVSKWLNKVPRFTNVELSKVQDALLPSKDIIAHSTKDEYEKYWKFVNDINDSFNTTLSDLSTHQKNIIRQDVGLNNYPYLGKAMEQQPRIKVKRKSDGKEGTVMPNDFDPKKYERIK